MEPEIDDDEDEVLIIFLKLKFFSKYYISQRKIKKKNDFSTEIIWF